MLLKEPVTATKSRTKTTPMATRDAVRRVLLLYLNRFLSAIFKRLRISLTSFGLFSNQFSILQAVDDLGLTHDFLIMGGKDEGGLEFIPHLFHRLKDHK